ncbi:MAG: NUDIX domain-containing protein [Bdellovibrionales bacterium]|nr:NUDIX domain-containing protein [Bdellovibrionales bacterium]
MNQKTKKAQVIIAAIDEASQSFKFLLLLTNEQRGKFWQNVTGKIEEEETFEEGGLREAIEETQLNIETIVDIVDLGLSYDFVDQRSRKVHEKSFLIICDKKWEIKIDPKEHQSFKWINQEEVKEGIVKYRSNLETLEKAKLILRNWGV